MFVDLLLAKPSVYRHLLYNEGAKLSNYERDKALVKLYLITVLADMCKSPHTVARSS